MTYWAKQERAAQERNAEQERRQERTRKDLRAVEPVQQEWRSEQLKAATYAQLKQRTRELSEQKAKELLTRKDIRAILCPALQSVSNDAFDIAKVITPILAGLAIAGTIAIPLVPVLFASIALVISRSGIAAICAEYGKAKEQGKK